MADFLIIDDNKNDSWIQKKKSSKNIIDKVNDFLLSLQKIKTKEKAIFYRLLSTMTNSWIWVMKSVSILEKQEKNKILKQILQDFERDLSNWVNLSDCLEKYPNIFSDSEVWMVKSWEKTGKLNTSLRDLAEQIEKIDSISWKLKSALMYPFFIILVVFWVIFVLMTMVVPKLLEIFWDPSELPTSTKTLMFVSDFFSNYWYLMIIVIVVFTVVVMVWKKTPDGKYMFDNIMLKIPIFWDINKKVILSKFSRVLSGLVSSWVSIVESLKITSDAVGNEVYKQRIILLSEDVSGWIRIYESLESDKLFPDMMVQMIRVWEETAKMDETITKVADFYDEQVDNTVSVINKLLEPFIIVVLAVIVGLIALWIMEPIMSIADTVWS